MPRISVIVPVYRVEPYLCRCVESIQNQTFQDFDLILVDDGSPDNCPAMCDEWARLDSRIVVIHQKNGGLSAARNAGIDWSFANSNSEWLTFIDSDDWISPVYLQCLLDAALENNVSVSICGYFQTDGKDPEISQNLLAAAVWDTEKFYVEHTINATVAWGKLYRKMCFQNMRYPIGKIHEDEYTTYRILFDFDRVSVVPAPLYAYYFNSEGITKKPWNSKRLDAVDAFELQLDYFEEFGYIKAFNVRIISYFQELTNMLKYISRNPFKDVLTRMVLHKKRIQVFARMNFVQRASVCNELHPKVMRIYWFAFTGVRMLLQGEWEKLLQKIKNKILS